MNNLQSYMYSLMLIVVWIILATADKDECRSNPCLNGGICIDDSFRFDCICPPNFSGATCDEEIELFNIKTTDAATISPLLTTPTATATVTTSATTNTSLTITAADNSAFAITTSVATATTGAPTNTVETTTTPTTLPLGLECYQCFYAWFGMVDRSMGAAFLDLDKGANWDPYCVYSPAKAVVCPLHAQCGYQFGRMNSQQSANVGGNQAEFDYYVRDCVVRDFKDSTSKEESCSITNRTDVFGILPDKFKKALGLPSSEDKMLCTCSSDLCGLHCNDAFIIQGSCVPKWIIGVGVGLALFFITLLIGGVSYYCCCLRTRKMVLYRTDKCYTCYACCDQCCPGCLFYACCPPLYTAPTTVTTTTTYGNR